MLSHGINFGACPFLKQPDLFCVNWNILSKTDFIIMISGCNEFDVFFLLIESTSPPPVSPFYSLSCSKEKSMFLTCFVEAAANLFSSPSVLFWCVKPILTRGVILLSLNLAWLISILSSPRKVSG